MKFLILLMFTTISVGVSGQELYVYSEPASNMPARSISVKMNSNFVARQAPEYRFMQRYMPMVMFGVNKNLMLHVATSFADMYTKRFRWESLSVYGKYRFLSNDDLHSHFRMAAFARGSYTRSPFHFDEIGLEGDRSGVEAGIIATQLWNKFAISATVSNTQVLDGSRNNKTIYIPSRIYQAMNYSLSGGFLVLPLEYTDYKQTNLNVYGELLAQQSLDRKAYFVDFAPAIQLIFNSNTKLNVGYRFQLEGDMQRMATNSWHVSIERTFLNALK